MPDALLLGGDVSRHGVSLSALLKGRPPSEQGIDVI